LLPVENDIEADRPVPGEGESTAIDETLEATLWQVTDDEDLTEATGLFHRDRAFEELGWTTYTSQRPCPKCGSYDAQLSERKGQNVVRCRRCKAHIYNAPKTETGQRPRNVATIRRGIKPNQQVRILERDGACVLCGSREGLTLGHALSLKDAEAQGEVGPYLDGDENLFAMCEGCNSGLGGRSILPKTYHLIVLRLLQAADRRVQDSVERHPSGAS
jgi:5-methylcytosine-specific restriction endonuclease McrA